MTTGTLRMTTGSDGERTPSEVILSAAKDLGGGKLA